MGGRQKSEVIEKFDCNRQSTTDSAEIFMFAHL